MNRTNIKITPLKENLMKTYIFKVVIEPDEDVFVAYCPALKGCVTWGKTADQALKHIRDAVEAYVEDAIQAGETIRKSTPDLYILPAPAVSVTV